MADERPPPPSEVVFIPQPSWAPAGVAIGLAVALAGAFAGWFYAALGGLIALIALWIWIRQFRAETARLPIEQAVDTAVLPPVNVRRTDGR